MGTEPSQVPDETLRVDARHNRDRILAAARDLFTTRGPDVPVTAIARRAGVGVATVYRRFPTRDDLVTAAFAGQLRECVALFDRALADPDPWRAFCLVIAQVARMQATDQGFTGALLSQLPRVFDYERQRNRAAEGIAELVRRAKETGRLRPDFDPDDIVMVLLAVAGVAQRSGPDAPTATARLVGYLLQSFRAPGAAPLPEPVALDLDRFIESAR